MPVVQRLGYLLDRTGHGDLVGELDAFVEKHKPKMVTLEPRSTEAVSARDRRWRILVNTTIEVEA
ncbi:MAG: hypothetical protein IT384_12660 [Deltaproteobacteria bacterium]|nr:hypothetical protein [Deltaproteobacteria bacterium]